MMFHLATFEIFRKSVAIHVLDNNPCCFVYGDNFYYILVD